MDRREKKTRTGTLIALAAALALSGCGQDQISNPTSQFSGRPIQLPATEQYSQGLQAQELPSVTVLVSAATGGTVTLGRYTLDFPAGALSSDTPITITQTDPHAMVLELQPHGIQFQKPVTLSAQVSDLVTPSASVVGVAWFNETTGAWEVVNQQSVSSPEASGQLWHFSDYAVFEE
jgi:hypothetical protein